MSKYLPKQQPVKFQQSSRSNQPKTQPERLADQDMSKKRSTLHLLDLEQKEKIGMKKFGRKQSQSPTTSELRMEPKFNKQIYLVEKGYMTTDLKNKYQKRISENLQTQYNIPLLSKQQEGFVQKLKISRYQGLQKLEWSNPQRSLQASLNQKQTTLIQKPDNFLDADEKLKLLQGKQPIGNQTYTYYVDKGNNHDIVKQILRKRSWMIEQVNGNRYYLFKKRLFASVNFRWKPTSKDLNYSQLTPASGNKRITFNHIEAHKEMTTKQRLFANLRYYCNKNKINMNQFVPQTFILNIDGQSFQQELKEFIDEFLKKKYVDQSKNFWIMKPPDLNRGQGIQIFNDLRMFIQHLLEFCKIKGSMTQGKTSLKNVYITYPSDKFDVSQDENGMTTMNFLVEQIQGNTERQIVIQKYLENPLLFQGRKFDFRVWVLVDQQMQYYFFREGYIRLSSEPFDLSMNSIKNLFIHLTNNAIQKHHTKYSKYELGNQLSFPDLQNYFNSRFINYSVKEKLIPRMKELVKLTLQSVQDKFVFCNSKYQFEIFGYDFMIDSEFNIWLIEINTNPCIETSSPLLEKLIPRMLNDSFRLTIDKILNPFKSTESDKPLPEKFYDFLDDFQVPGYNNGEVLWDFVGKVF